MSRRKQSKPRQIKRSLGDLVGEEENTPDNLSLSGEEGGASDPDDSAEGDASSTPAYTSLYNDGPRTNDSAGGPGDEDEEGEEPRPTHSDREEEEDGEEEEGASPWRGPDDLEYSEGGGDSSSSRVVVGRDLRPDTTWGPYPGILQSEGSTDDRETEVRAVASSLSSNRRARCCHGYLKRRCICLWILILQTSSRMK